MMKVLHVLGDLSIKSGINTVVMNYIQSIDKKFFEFSIVYFDKYNGETYEEEFIKLGVKLYYVERRYFIKKWYSFCRAHFKEFDILHFHFAFLSFAFIDAKKRLGVKSIIAHSHATKFSDSNKLSKNLVNSFLSLPARYISTKLLACSSDAGKQIFGEKFLKKGFVLKNAIDIEKFHPNIEYRTKIRKEYNLEESFLIGHVGNMTNQKNHKYLINVFYEVSKIRTDAALLLIGDGYLRNELINMIDEYNLNDKVFFTGIVDNVQLYYNAMDLFVFPSIFEGLGIALVEAQACGVQCIYSDKVPDEADIYKETNLRLPLNDEKKWIDAILHFKKKNFYDKKILIDEGYDIKSATKILEKIYINLLRNENKNEI